MRQRTVLLIGVMAVLVAACTEVATLQISAGTGPQPVLPAPRMSAKVNLLLSSERACQ